MITCSIASTGTPARSSAARIAAAPSSGAVSDASPPPNPPIGVRAAETRNACDIPGIRPEGPRDRNRRGGLERVGPRAMKIDGMPGTAVTADDYSEASFWSKLTRVWRVAGRVLIERALRLYYAARDPRTPPSIKRIIYAALA